MTIIKKCIVTYELKHYTTAVAQLRCCGKSMKVNNREDAEIVRPQQQTKINYGNWESRREGIERQQAEI